MCPPGRSASALGAVLLALAPGPGAAADDVAAYLERLGLNELLSVHLEERFAVATGERRDELTDQLAGLYARLLEGATDPVRQADLMERSRRLLADAPSAAAGGLRLAVLRATYRTAEHIAEKHRLRLATEEDVDRARAILTDLIPELNRLRKRGEKNVRSVDDRLRRARGTEAIVLAEEVEEARRLHAQTTFLTAWSLYYQSWLHGRPDNARAAERHFIELLDFGDQSPIPEHVSIDLRSTEAIARCILGMALCRSLTATRGVALGWAALLEHERTYPALREEAAAWRIAILLEHGQFLTVRSELEQGVADGREIPLPWLRLAAVHALEDEADTVHARDLARYAVTRLAARGHLGQVFDLAGRYGIEALGTSGFALRYVNGVLLFHEARTEHGAEAPTDRPDLIALYERSAHELREAEGQPDAAAYADALPDCSRLIAWCLFFQGELRQGRAAFERAAAVLPPDEAAEALWMAIVCLDRLALADDRASALSNELSALVARFLREHPTSEHAPRLVLREALRSEEVSPEVVQDLLSIPPGSPVHGAARRRAAQVLYRLFRDERGGQRLVWADRYLAVAGPMHAREGTTLDQADVLAWQRFLVRARRILEVALHESVGRREAALSVLRGLDELAAGGIVDLGDVEREVDYRRLQERLLAGDLAAAGRIADRLWADGPTDLWARLGVRAMLRHGTRAWRAAERTRTDDRAAIALVLTYGPRVLAEHDGDPAALDDRAVLARAVTVAEAAMAVWERSGDGARGREALARFGALLAARPTNARFLRATALLAGELGEPARAIECWRTLVAGSAGGSDAWFEARYQLIRLLAETDADRARLVMRQHKALNPSYGPEPWGVKLRVLDLRLGTGSSDVADERGVPDGR